MNDIFANLYNKVLGFFRKTEAEEKSKDIACNRLRVVLMQDRTNLTPELMERMRKELVELLSRYVEMDKEALELNLEQDGEQVALMLSIPVIRAKEEEEIEKALADASKTEEKTSEDDTEEDSEEENISEDDDVEEDTEELATEEENEEISEEVEEEEVKIEEIKSKNK